MSDANGLRGEDVGNILYLEHVNVRVPDQGKATLFYIVGLGFTRDPYMMVGVNNMWVNLGDNQCHLPTGQPQVVRGHVGIVTPDLTALKDRLASIRDGLAGTSFDFSDEGEYVRAICPWGNEYRCYGPSDRFSSMTRGIPYVEFAVSRGTAKRIGEFYQRGLGAPYSMEDSGDGLAAHVESGINQELVFRESDAAASEYDGHHIQIYILNFSKPFEFMNERGLVSEGINNHQFRFVDIVDPDTGEKLFNVEHEVRGARHRLYRRPLVNRPVELLSAPTVVPMVVA
ncbi:MAG: VOC family protein [Chloroflexota bacterium]